MKENLLNKTIRILLFVFLAALILFHGRPFLVPLAFAGLFSMLLLPLSIKLEERGLNRAVAIILSILVLVLFFGGIFFLLAWQVSDLSSNSDQIEKNISQKLRQIQDYVSGSFGISRQKQQELIQDQQKTSGTKMSTMLSGAFSSFGTFLTNAIIVIVYVFLLSYFRDHLRKFMMMLVPASDHANAGKIISNSRKVAQKYLTGMALMIGGLWILYSIGFSLAGVRNPFFFAILCGLLEIVPFVGNLVGVSLTMIFTLAQGGDMNTVIAILITYVCVQFFQTYVLEPLVVGSEVSINPVFTIIGIVGGEFIWGIPGMILAIPVLGIIKIVCDNIESLKPYGFLIGEEKTRDKKKPTDKLKGLFRKRRVV